MAISKKNNLVGLDIGSHTIKVVELEHSNRGRVLRNFGVIATPQGAIVEGSVKNVGEVSAAIRNLFRNLKVKNRNVAISLSGYSVIAKKIVLDKMEESEIEKAIKEEAEKYIPYGINEVNLDYTVLSPGDTIGQSADEKEGPWSSGQMEVLLVAGKSDVIDGYLALIQAANLNLGVLDVDAFALQNAAEISIDNPEGNYAISTVGASELGINTLQRGLSVFSRDSPYGGAQITNAIMSEFDVPFEEAEKIKLGGVDVDDKKNLTIEQIRTSTTKQWIREVKHALDFVANTYPDEAIEKIFVSGGSCETPDFQHQLEQETNIPVTELNPFRYLTIDSKLFDSKYLKRVAPQAGVAVGLALRSIGDK